MKEISVIATTILACVTHGGIHDQITAEFVLVISQSFICPVSLSLLKNGGT